MKTYLVLLNWSLALVFISAILWPHPYIQGWMFPIGLFIGAMFTAGTVSWEYYKDPSADKDWRWRRNYFRKDYAIEITVQVMVAGVAFGLSFMFWHPFFMLLTGFFGAWVVNIIVEWLWAVTHRYYNK